MSKSDNKNAKDIILRAVQCDQAGRILEAQTLYQDGIQMLMDMVNMETDLDKKKVYYERIKEYLDRAEQIKEKVQKHTVKGQLVANIPIEENSSGNSYETLFGSYLTVEVKELLLEEPYLMEKYQFQNLVQFLELVVKNCARIKCIKVVTKRDSKPSQDQFMDQIKADLAKREITLIVKHEDTLHDRKIVLSNGIIIKIGRGLHYFKANNPLYALGLCDYDFRKCLQTDIDIWRTKKFE